MLSKFVLVLFFPLISHAVTVTIENENRETLFTQPAHYRENLPTVGDITIATFEKYKIPYKGSVEGISEIFGTPQRVEVISETELKAYGWCFSLDGKVPETLTHETKVEFPESHIKWFYAFAYFKDGKWISQCAR